MAFEFCFPDYARLASSFTEPIFFLSRSLQAVSNQLFESLWESLDLEKSWREVLVLTFFLYAEMMNMRFSRSVSELFQIAAGILSNTSLEIFIIVAVGYKSYGDSD